MDKYKKLFFLIILNVFFCCLPLSVMAKNDNAKTVITETYVNPVYKDVIDVKELEHRISAKANTPTAKISYTTSDQAVAETIRNKMVNRESVIEFHYKGKEGYNEEQLQKWMEMAFAETDNSYEGDYLRWGYQGYRGNIAYGASGGYYYFDYSLEMVYYTTKKQEDELTAEIEKVLDSLDVDNEAYDDYEKTRLIYDYLCENITYDHENLNDAEYKLKFTAYAAMMHKTAVCQGYATLMYRMMEESGIDTRVVFGTSFGENHTWNLSNLGWNYYLYDSTWDAGESTYGYFAKGNNYFPNHTVKSNFLSNYVIDDDDYIVHDHIEEVIRPYREETCTEDGHTEETGCAVCGMVLDRSEVIAAPGHDYVENKCVRCGADKPYTIITVADTETNEAYTGEPIAIDENIIVIEKGNQEYQIRYYQDKECLVPTYREDSANAGKAPVETGIYYVKISTEETKEYRYTEVLHKLIIRPRKVASFNAENISSKIKLSWKMREEADGYYIYRKTENSDYKIIKTINDIATVTFSDADIRQKTKYRYNIVAFSNDEEGETTKSLKRSKGTNIVRTKIFSITNQDGSVKITWTKVPEAAGYRVYRKASGYSSYGLLKTIKNGTTTSYTDKYAKSIRNGKASYYYVEPYYKKSDGTILATNKKTNYYVSRPVISSLKKNSSTSMTVKWKKNESAAGYEIRYSRSSSMSDAKIVKIGTKSTVSKKITGLAKNKKYYVQIRSYKTYKDVKYYSAWSAKKSI